MKLQLFCSKYYFVPTLIPTILTLILLPAFLSLGFWQLQRATEKRLMQQDFVRRATLPFLQLNDIKSSLPSYRYRRVKLYGHFDNSHTFLLDNKFFHHQLGYHVLVPFVVAGTSSPILINRGWLPMGKSRAKLPTISVVSGEVTIEGLVELPPKRHFSLGRLTETTVDWPRRIQYIDLQQLGHLLARPIEPYMVLLAPSSTYGFVRDWTPIMTMDPARHIGYAIQWFIFAGILLVLFIVLHTKKSMRQK